MVERRKLKTRDTTDWEALVQKCLTGAGTNNWGCLNKKCRLFRIATFSSVIVPSRIVNKMIRKGRLVLTDSDYYKYIIPRQRRVI